MKKSESYLEKLQMAAEYWQEKVDALPGDSISVNDPRYKMANSTSAAYAAAKTMRDYMIEEAKSEQAKKQHTAYYEYSDGPYYNTVSFEQAELSDREFANRFFTEVSRGICFADCGGYEITRIVFNGQLVHYAGWQPDMVYEYKSENGETVWGNSFPQWDH